MKPCPEFVLRGAVIASAAAALVAAGTSGATPPPVTASAAHLNTSAAQIKDPAHPVQTQASTAQATQAKAACIRPDGSHVDQSHWEMAEKSCSGAKGCGGNQNMLRAMGCSNAPALAQATITTSTGH